MKRPRCKCGQAATFDSPKPLCTFHWVKWYHAGYTRDDLLKILADQFDAQAKSRGASERLLAKPDLPERAIPPPRRRRQERARTEISSRMKDLLDGGLTREEAASVAHAAVDDAYRALPRSRRAKNPKGVELAAVLLQDPATRAWMEGIRARYAGDQLAFVDVATPHYLCVMRALPLIAAKIVATLARIGARGARLSEVALVARVDPRSTASYLTRMARAGLVEALKEGGERTRYRVADRDLRRFLAVRAGGRELREFLDRPDLDLATAIDDYIAHLEEKSR